MASLIGRLEHCRSSKVNKPSTIWHYHLALYIELLNELLFYNNTRYESIRKSIITTIITIGLTEITTQSSSDTIKIDGATEIFGTTYQTFLYLHHIVFRESDLKPLE